MLTPVIYELYGCDVWRANAGEAAQDIGGVKQTRALQIMVQNHTQTRLFSRRMESLRRAGNADMLVRNYRVFIRVAL